MIEKLIAETKDRPYMMTLMAIISLMTTINTANSVSPQQMDWAVGQIYESHIDTLALAHDIQRESILRDVAIIKHEKSVLRLTLSMQQRDGQRQREEISLRMQELDAQIEAHEVRLEVLDTSRTLAIQKAAREFRWTDTNTLSDAIAGAM